MRDLGWVQPGTTLYLPFHTFDSNDPAASVTLTGLATTDIEIYKDGGTTQRASDSGYALLDTDGIDFDTITGIHGISIDLSDNTTAGFYAAGSQYWVVISSVTVDAATVNFVLATFKIGYPGAILNTDIAAYTSTDNFTLAGGSADDDAYNGCILVAHDVASAVQVQWGVIEDYTGASKTVNLKADPGVFTMAANDNISIFPPSLVSTIRGTTIDVTATGAAGVDWGNVENPTTAVDLSGTDIQLCDTVTTNSDMRGTDSAALASVVGALTDAAAAGDPTTADTIMQYVKQLVNVLVGTTGVTTFPAAAAPANNVSLAEIIRAIYDDSNDLQANGVTVATGGLAAAGFAAGAVDAAALAADAVDEILDETIGDGTLTMRETLRVCIAALAGKLSGAATTTVTIRNDADSADVIVATVDADGNRSAVTLTP